MLLQQLLLMMKMVVVDRPLHRPGHLQAGPKILLKITGRA